MNRHLDNQSYLGPLFVLTNNAGIEKHFIPVPRNLLLTYKGPLASDKQRPHDIAVRAAANRAYKLSTEERARKWMEARPDIYAAFCEMAFIEHENGYGSAKFIAECLRRRKDLAKGKGFKIPNAFITYMAIRFEDENPRCVGTFKINKRKK